MQSSMQAATRSNHALQRLRASVPLVGAVAELGSLSGMKFLESTSKDGW